MTFLLGLNFSVVMIGAFGLAERMTARISEIEIQYVRLPMTEISADD